MQLYLIRDVTTSFLTFGFCEDIPVELRRRQRTHPHPLELVQLLDVTEPESALLVLIFEGLIRWQYRSFQAGEWYILWRDLVQGMQASFAYLSTVLNQERAARSRSLLGRIRARLRAQCSPFRLLLGR